MNRTGFSRRHFLRTSALVGVGGGLVPHLASRASSAQTGSANDRPHVLAIGVRGRGRGVAVGASTYGRVVACCDVDTSVADEFLDQLSEYQEGKPDVYTDYRKALARKDVDVVTIATPDHWHAAIAIEAMRAGKDVYLEKPMTLTIEEGQLVCQVAKQTGRVVQVGTQQRTEYNGMFLKAVALARSGRLGKTLTATVMVSASYKQETEPFPTSDPPKTLDWDRWLGPTPKVPYCPQRCHGSWRNWVEYGCGPLTDWGVHYLDIGQWALGAEKTGPVEIEGQGDFPQGREATLAVLSGKKPATELPNGYSTVRDYHARLRFADGNTILIQGVNRPHKMGVLLEGEKGWIFINRDELYVAPDDDLRQALMETDWLDQEIRKLTKGKRLNWRLPAFRIGEIIPTTHMENFFQCAGDRSEPMSDVFTHHRSNSSCLLAHIAMLVGRKLTWDPRAERIVGDDEANVLLGRKRREPYAIRV